VTDFGRDESTPVSVVKKYIAKKLGLADDSQVLANE
jgi:hypothetical protein